MENQNGPALSVIFLIHKTLGLTHAELSIRSLAPCSGLIKDILVYSSDADVKSSEVSAIFRREGFTSQVIHEVDTSSKSLTQDIFNVIGLTGGPYGEGMSEYVLLLKADYTLSANFTDVAVDNMQKGFKCWTLSGMNAKEFVPDEEIVDRLSQPFARVDPVTFYRGGTVDGGQELAPVVDGRLLMDTDPLIRYVSHSIRSDYNVHVISKDVLVSSNRGLLSLNSTWGGMEGYIRSLGSIEDDRAFWVHKYHTIVSVNRSEDRGDTRKTIPGNRY